MRFRFHLQFLCLTASSFVLAGRPASADDKIDFNRDVRPILSDKCLACHGADAKHVEGDLRLDQFDTAIAALESGDRAIVPGKPESSELIRRIRLADEDEMRMPPVRSHKNLTANEKQTLDRWIAQGAEYKKHWAFIPPTRPNVAVGEQAWGSNAIDALVLAKLKAEGLKPSQEGSRATLIRRASLDLTGLPPTLAEVESFVNDPMPTSNAYEKVIDRLLESPRYAERMTMWWLDGARYADSNGFQSDDQRYMHGWRDWVLNAFRSNMPFDQFTVEQLAGDLIPDATLDQKIATGFNRNNRQNSEGGLIAEEWRIEGVIDRVEATSAVWMALTIGCARCHDHKYDPISQKEMYQFFSYFNNVPESGVASPGNTAPLLRIPRPQDDAKLLELEAAVAKADQAQKELDSKLNPAAEAWARDVGVKLLERASSWRIIDVNLKGNGNKKFMVQADGSYRVSGKTPAKDVYTLSTTVSQPRTITAIQLEAIPHSTNAANGFGRKGNGNIVLGEFEAETSFASTPETVTKLKIARAFADYSQENWNISAAIDGNPATGWALDGLDPTKQVTRHAVFVLAEPVVLAPDSKLTIRLKQEALADHNLGLFRLSTTDEPDVSDSTASPLTELLVAALSVSETERTEAQKKAILDHYRTLAESPTAKSAAQLEAAKKSEVRLRKERSNRNGDAGVASASRLLCTRTRPIRQTR